jgi:hypothetical protein
MIGFPRGLSSCGDHQEKHMFLLAEDWLRNLESQKVNHTISRHYDAIIGEIHCYDKRS